MDSKATSKIRRHLGVLPPQEALGWEWVEATESRLGTIHELPDTEAAWKRVEKLGLRPYSPERPRDPRITFGEVAAHYVRFELPDDQTNVTIEKSQSTIT